MLDHGMAGLVDVVTLEKIDAPHARGTVRSRLTGGSQTCIMNPSPYLGIMPLENSLLAVYRPKAGGASRMILPLAELVDVEKRDINTRLKDVTTDPAGTEEPPGMTMRLKPGECYFGRFARLFMDSAGNARMFNGKMDVSLTLNNTTKKAEIRANNFLFETNGGGISIRTSPSVPNTFGDTVRIDKNITLPLTPEEIGAPPLPTNLARIEIDLVGGISLFAAKTAPLVAAAELTLSELGFPGRARLQNQLSSITLSAIGDIDSVGPLCRLSMKAVGAVLLEAGTISTYRSPTSATIDTPILNITGSVNYTAPDGSSSVSTGNFTLVCPKFFVTSPGTELSGNLSVTGTTTLTGVLTVIATPIFTGVPIATPLSSVTTVAKIPVLVNGVIAGFIPVIP